jgi:hypothetical protein
MASYININGNNIPIRASDPANPIIGEVWYNSTTNELKGQSVTTSGTFSTGGNLNTARSSINVAGPIGSQTAGLAAGGQTAPTTRTNATEEYNGSTWSSVNPTINTLSSRGGVGTQTAGLIFGGLPNPVAVALTEGYDGTSWTAANAMNNARGYGITTGGTKNAAMAAGGYHPPVTFVTSVEFYDGTSWTNQAGTIQPNYAGGSAGSQSSAWYVGAGGVGVPTNRLTYDWNGTSWTAGNPYNDTSKTNFFSGGPQSGTSGWIIGGDYDPGISDKTETYDGTSWTNDPATLSQGRYIGGSGGDSSNGLIIGGNSVPGTYVATTEEFTGAGSPQTVTISFT